MINSIEDFESLIEILLDIFIDFYPILFFILFICLFPFIYHIIICLVSFLGAITKSKPSNYYLEEDLSNETNEFDISDKFDYINDLSRYTGGEQYLKGDDHKC